MRSNLYWLSNEQWREIEPYLPTDARGKERADDRRLVEVKLFDGELPVISCYEAPASA